MRKEPMSLHSVTAELLLETDEYGFLEQIEDDDDFLETMKSLARASEGLLAINPPAIGRLIDVACNTYDLYRYQLGEGDMYGRFILYGDEELFVVLEWITNAYGGYQIDHYEPGDKMYNFVKEMLETGRICESEVDAGTFLYWSSDGERFSVSDLYECAAK